MNKDTLIWVLGVRLYLEKLLTLTPEELFEKIRGDGMLDVNESEWRKD